MQAYELAEVLAERQRLDQPYLEFLRVAALSAGVYHLPAGGVDPQLPHTEDEVYYVVSGRGSLKVGGEDRPVAPGTLVYVDAQVEHRFHSILEDLVLLVFFAPAEYSQRGAPPSAS